MYVANEWGFVVSYNNRAVNTMAGMPFCSTSADSRAVDTIPTL